ncbi:thiamine-phosphate diphosphorylase [Tepidamorphus gemmatus]|uniref:Thiamine-phosphate diphosphorylase n=1 Tax=Tepidamorphus gemmatus TaxID=747076 RepID=A0A4R3MKR3_9HYPH|nr:thiamine phosphate synthase [Tepidamorphus gemmatus]TCT13328.1 thiamine-phosphate diphosphorylase [Tepidamorphus gemmatus]
MVDTRTRLFLVTPTDLLPAAFASVLSDALAGGDVAAVMLDLATQDPAVWRQAANVLCPIVQERGAAFLLRNQVDLARETGADGVHVTEGPEALERALRRLKPDMIVGAGDCITRHAAMVLGEKNPDYVFLGRLDPVEDIPASHTLVDWWAELFELPCVALAGDDWTQAAEAVEAGADFLALRDLVWSDPRGAADALRRAQALCTRAREVAA